MGGEDGTFDLSDQLKLAIDEEHWFLDAQHKREAFYSSIITAVIAATIAGVLNATTGLHKVFLVVGPFMVFALTSLAQRATRRFYLRYLEAVTIRAKIEQALNLTRSLPGLKEDDYWKDEPVVPTRHLDARRDKPSSAEFCDSRVRGGYQESTRTLFDTLWKVAAVLAALLILSAFWDWVT